MAVRYMQKCACVITFRVYFKKDFYFNFVYVYAFVHEYIATGGHRRVVDLTGDPEPPDVSAET